MDITLNFLSDKEQQLYQYAVSLHGTMEDKTQHLSNRGIFDEYSDVHKQYLKIFRTTPDSEIKLEALKRLVFLNWYFMLEPRCFTGIGDLHEATVLDSYEILNDYIRQNKLDKELLWMLCYYANWDWTILSFSENRFQALTEFVKSINLDPSILHVPKHQLPKQTMNNRGQMGIYWKSHSVEVT